ncbi:MAG: WGR domain-containing protein [Noviherbaspirillum sp.]
MAALPEDPGPPRPLKYRFTWHTRFYTAVLERDLFGQWTVTRSWGSTRNGQGGGRMTVVESFEAGVEVLRVIAKRREKLGYLNETTIKS